MFAYKHSVAVLDLPVPTYDVMHAGRLQDQLRQFFKAGEEMFAAQGAKQCQDVLTACFKDLIWRAVNVPTNCMSCRCQSPLEGCTRDG